jgi:hypothetical protein
VLVTLTYVIYWLSASKAYVSLLGSPPGSRLAASTGCAA